jgi:hypothetical protein
VAIAMEGGLMVDKAGGAVRLHGVSKSIVPLVCTCD